MLALTGCTVSGSTDVDLKDPPLVDQYPVTVGIYYPPELGAFECRSEWDLRTWRFDVGVSSMKLYDTVFAGMFREMVRLEQLPPGARNDDSLAGIISLSAVECGLVIASVDKVPVTGWRQYRARLVYKFELFSPDHDKIAEWSITGHGIKDHEISIDHGKWPAEAIRRAIRHSAVQFIDGFDQNRDVRRWLDGRPN